MDSCPRPITTTDVDKLKSKLGSEYDLLVKGIEELTKQCPKISQKGAKKKRKGSKSKKRRQKGGNILSAQTFKYITYAIFTVIMGYMTSGGSIAMEGILNGLSAVFSGECGTMGNQLWGIFGLANPVCAAYNSTMLLITNALALNPMAWGALGSLAYATLKAPFILASSVKISTYLMARVIPAEILAPGQLQVLYQEALGALPQVLAITNSQQQQQIQNIFPAAIEAPPQSAAAANSEDSGLARTSSIEDAASGLLSLKNSNTSYGGKKRKSKKTKKTKKRRTRKY